MTFNQFRHLSVVLRTCSLSVTSRGRSSLIACMLLYTPLFYSRGYVWFSDVCKLLKKTYHTQYILLKLVYALIFSRTVIVTAWAQVSTLVTCINRMASASINQFQIAIYIVPNECTYITCKFNVYYYCTLSGYIGKTLSILRCFQQF